MALGHSWCSCFPKVTRVIVLFYLIEAISAQSIYATQPAPSSVKPTQAPATLTLKSINPPGRMDLSSTTTKVTLTGTGFTDSMTLGFAPSGVLRIATPNDWHQVNGVSATVTLEFVDPNTAIQSVNIWLIAPDNTTSGTVSFNTGVATSVCLEALKTGECALLWQVDATSATAATGQTNNSTAPNIIVRLDYQWHGPKNQQQKALLRQQFASTAVYTAMDGAAQEKALAKFNDSKLDHLAGHVSFKTGYTQVVTASNVQPTNSGGTAAPSTACPNGSTTSSTTCKAAIPQQAFVADVAGRLGWTTGVTGEGTFGEFGLTARGSFQYLVPSNKVVQSGGQTFIALSSANPQDAVGFYEATAHFRLAQLGHDKTMPNANTQNTSDLLVFEGGYQNNRGLQQLGASPQTNTRNRYVARFYVSPEISRTNHTQLTMGLEYSGGMDGGPHVVQLFFGANLNPASLFSGNK